MKIEIKHKGSCLGATGGGRNVVDDDSLGWPSWYWVDWDPSRFIACGVTAAIDFELPCNRSVTNARLTSSLQTQSSLSRDLYCMDYIIKREDVG